MNRRQFLKKSLLGIIPLVGCGTVSNDTSLKTDKRLIADRFGNKLLLDKELVADNFGDKNGIASPEELAYIDDYFKFNSEAWCLTAFPKNYDYVVPVLEVINTINRVKLSGPFKTERELRNYYEKINLVTSWVSILELVPEKDMYKIQNYYKSTGFNVSKRKWSYVSVK